MSTKVASVADLPRGLRAFEFRPRDWTDPFEYHVWCEVTADDEVQNWKQRLMGVMTNWHTPDGQVLVYEISHDPVHRPMLVCIAGIL
jgi:hypothetical protein